MSYMSISFVCKIYLILFAVVQICSPLTENPNIQKRLSKNDLQKALGTFAAHTMRTVSIPNYSGKSGKWRYGVSNMRITRFDTPQIRLQYYASLKKASLTTQIGHVSMKGDWRFKYRSWWPLRYSDSGRFRLTLNRIRFTLAASIRSVQNAHKVSITRCHCYVNSAKIHLSGGGGWLYRLWNRRIERKITKAINNKVCHANCQKIKAKKITI